MYTVGSDNVRIIERLHELKASKIKQFYSLEIIDEKIEKAFPKRVPLKSETK